MVKIEQLPDVETYIQKINSYCAECFKSGKKITPDEWNSLFLALIGQGNMQEETLANIYDKIVENRSTLNRAVGVINSLNIGEDGSILGLNIKNGEGDGSVISSWTKDEDDGKEYDYAGILGFGKKEFEDPETGKKYNYMPEATQQEAFAFGKGAKAFGLRSLAIGTAVIAEATGAIALGQILKASGIASFVIGNQNVAAGPYAVATGHKNYSKGDMSFTSGRENQANQNWAAAFGVRNIANGLATFITGIDNESTSYAGFTSGTNNHNDAEKSFVTGDDNTNNGACSIVNGKHNFNEAACSAIIGECNTNKGIRSFVTGGASTADDGNVCYGANSAILGGYYNNIGSKDVPDADYNVIAGGNSNTIYNGTRNFVANAGNYVYGSYKAVFGYANKSSNNGSTQFICGKYSAVNDDALFIVGGGSTAKRSNAFEVLQDGRAKLYKDAQDNYDIVNKGYVDRRVGKLYKHNIKLKLSGTEGGLGVPLAELIDSSTYLTVYTNHPDEIENFEGLGYRLGGGIEPDYEIREIKGYYVGLVNDAYPTKAISGNIIDAYTLGGGSLWKTYSVFVVATNSGTTEVSIQAIIGFTDTVEEV